MEGDGRAEADGSSAGRHDAGAEIKTFLIADVRGYTVFTNTQGDEAAARLAARFAGLVRERVQAWGGSLVELRGDEALVVFSSARQAIRAAVDLQIAFVDATVDDPSLPLTVGIGLDAGEAVPVEGGYRGGALNLAARLCGQATRGQVLASQEVVHLARRIEGITFIGRGTVELKGLDQPVPIIQVVPDSGDPAKRLDAFLPAGPPPPRRRPTRRLVAVGVAAVVIAILAISVPIVLSSGGTSVPLLAANGIELIDTSTARPDVVLPLAGTPGSLASGAGSVWASDAQDGAVLQISPQTHTVIDKIPVGSDPAGIAVGDEAVWVAVSGAGQVVRIDPTSDTVVARIGVGNGPTAVAISGPYVWVTNYVDDTVVRVDSRTNRMVPHSTVLVGNQPGAIAANSAGAWVANAGDATVTRISLTGLGTKTIAVGNGPAGVSIGPRSVWVTNELDGTLSRIDPESGVVLGTTPVGSGPTGVATDANTVWVANHYGTTVSRLNEATGVVGQPVQLNAAPDAVTIVSGQLWVAAAATPSTHRGGTLRFASKAAPDSIDPAFAYFGQAWQILSMTNDGLLGFARVAGPKGGTLVADLATSIPEPSDGGRTYTFQVRPGIHYSTGALVRPEDFRLGIERTLVNNPLNQTPASYYTDIVGAASCTTARICDLSRGLVVNDASHTVTFHLAHPDPEFLDKLGLTFADAVPTGTSLALTKTVSLPATGPYTATWSTTKTGVPTSVVLTRNPHFAQWSATAQPAGYPDRIEGTYGVSAAEEVARVESGQLDAMDDPPPASKRSELNTRYPSQLTDAVLPAIFGFGLNSHLKPFNDPRVRKALNYAIDRNRLVALSGGAQVARVTCQVLPPDLGGYRRFCPYTRRPNAPGTWSGPDLRRARHLVAASGTADTKITIEMPTNIAPIRRSTGVYLRQLLDRLHYRASLKVIGSGKYFTLMQNPRHSAKVQIGLWGWQTDYPSAGNILPPLFGCGPESAQQNTSHFCVGAIQTQMNATLAEEATQPAAAELRWSAIDRLIVKQAPWLSLPTEIHLYFVSKRTGNVQVSPQWGLLLSQLWVH